MSGSDNVILIHFGLSCGSERRFENAVATQAHDKYVRWLNGEIMGPKPHNNVYMIEDGNVLEYIDFSSVIYVYVEREKDRE